MSEAERQDIPPDPGIGGGERPEFRTGTIEDRKNFAQDWTTRDNTNRGERKALRRVEQRLRKDGILEEGETVVGYVDVGSWVERPEWAETIRQLETGAGKVETTPAVYEAIRAFLVREKRVATKYKTVDKKVKPIATPLPEDAAERIRAASREPRLRNPGEIGHTWTEESLA